MPKGGGLHWLMWDLLTTPGWCFLPTPMWMARAIDSKGDAYALCLYSPQGPQAVWNCPRDGPLYPLQRYRQLTLDAAEATILFNISCMPEVEIPKRVLSIAAFHKDVAE